MNPTACNIIGIVGGMGPKAGISLLDRIVVHTPARSDQQHLPVLLLSFPGHIPDRTAYLEGRTQQNPAFPIAHMLQILEQAGATVGGIACNTSHAPGIYNVILHQLRRTDCRIKLLHMPMETCLSLKKNHPGAKRVGLLTTNGTYRSGLYKKILLEMGFEVIDPGLNFQTQVIHKMIYDQDFGLKARPREPSKEAISLYAKASRFFLDKRSDALILGCTDIPLSLAETTSNGIPVIDSTDTLAKALIRESLVNPGQQPEQSPVPGTASPNADSC
jgi:aspartate racemase